MIQESDADAMRPRVKLDGWPSVAAGAEHVAHHGNQLQQACIRDPVEDAICTTLDTSGTFGPASSGQYISKSAVKSRTVRFVLDGFIVSPEKASV